MSAFSEPIDTLIVTYNSERYISKCVRSLRKHVPQCRIHVVDNASTDKTKLIVNKLKVDSYTQNLSNRLLTPVWNEFLGLAETKIVLLLNPDVTILNGKPLIKAADELMKNQRAIAAGRSVPVTYKELMGWIPPVRPADREVFRKLLLKNIPDGECLDNLVIDCLDGSCLLVKRDLALQLGGFSEELPFYFNDTEFSWRARQAGYEILVEWAGAENVFEHDAQASSQLPPPGIRLKIYKLKKRLLGS